MSTVVLKRIALEPNTESIEKAIADLKKFQEQLDAKKMELIEKLAEKGAEIATQQIGELGAIATGALQQSITYNVKVQDRTASVLAGEGVDYAPYVEYGTGVVGAGSPHPGIASGESQPPVMTYTTDAGETHVYDKYDSQGHGDKGWTYFDRYENWHHTAGYKSRPFMYNTLRELEKIAPEKASEILLKGYSD